MRKIYLLLLIVFITAAGNSQNIANYTFTPSSGTFTPLVGSTVEPTLVGDDVNSLPIPLGFTFYFMGLPYTTVTANSNGWLSFNPSPTTSTVDMRTNNLATTATGLHPIIAPVWDDLEGRTTVVPNPVASYLTSGAVGSRVFTFEWLNWGRFGQTTPSISFQARLFEATGAIEFVYRQEVNATNFTSASSGIGDSPTSFASLSNFSAAPTISNVTSTNTITTRPATGQVYTFTPPLISGGPANLTFTAVGPGSMTLNWNDNATNESGFGIYRSLDGINYTLVSTTAANATSSVQGGLMPSTLYFWRVVAFTEGSVSSPASGSQATTACGAPLPAGTYSVGPTGTYPTLTAALAAIDNGTSGAVILELQPTYTSAGETFPISFRQPTCPAGAITVRPQAAVAAILTITSANTTATIDINGGTNVTIDGRPGGVGTSRFIGIANTSTASGGTAIRFINEASNNTIRNTVLSSLFPSTTSGVVVFSNTTGANGNDNNVLENNNIDGGAGATASPTLTATNGIFSSGTTTTTASNNSGNTILNNNIFDFFNAGLASNGISLAGGNTDWTITGNNLYQTASRTTTASNQYTGILINNSASGNNFLVNNNFIGGSAAGAGGTAWTITNATFTNRFVGIQLTAGTTAASSIQGNTITNFNVSTNSSASTTNGNFSGIWSSAGNVNIGTVTGNIIGATTGTGAITVTLATNSGGLANLISYSGTGVVDIRNNTVGAINLLGATATIGQGANGILVSGGTPTIIGNTIGNNTVANSINSSTAATGTQSLFGIQVTTGVTVPTTISNNIIANMNQAATGTGSLIRGIQYAGTGFGTITGNTIHDLSGATSNTTVAGGATGVTGIVYTGTSPAGALVSQNTVYTIRATNAGAVATVPAGIGYSNPSSGFVTRNRIYDIRNASTGTTATTPPMALGLLIRAALTEGTFANNMISLGNGQTTNTQFVGIMQSFFTNTVKIYFNSVNIEGTAASGALPSFGFLRGDNSATAITSPVDIKNNIFNNNRTGGTGPHLAIGNNYGTTASATGWGAGASNFNVLNANPATVGWWTTAQTFPGWQAASAGDANSLSGATINFVNTATADLHIAGATSPIEGAGTNISSITDDYDGQNRGLLTPTDIGADAGNFMTYPAISFAPFTTSCTAGARTLVATITDADGVPTAGAGLPVLYWRIGAGPYQAATATSLGGNQYQFTFGGGSVVGNTVSYYIVAQDNTGAVGSFPSLGAGGFTTNPPAAATAPTTPLSYTILPTLSGTYTVGAAGVYPTLTAAVNAYNTSCLGGPVIFSLIDPTYPSETFPITINSNSMASSVNTLTIKPAVPVTITGSTTTSIITLNGADWVTIDGSINNTANTVCPLSAATRDLTISNTNTATSTGVIWLGTTSAGDPVTNSSVINTIAIGNSGSTTILGIGAGGPSIGTGGTDNDNLSFINNEVRAARFGIYTSGAGATNKNEGLIINQNTMTAAAPNNIGETGIYVAFTNNVTVSGNSVGNIIRTGSPDGVGINLGFGAVSGISATATGIADGISNATITNNTIGVIENSGTFSSAGIVLGNTISGTSMIANNMVSGVIANGTAGDIAAGIMLGGGAGQVNVYNNTVAMQGTIPGATAASQISTAFAIIGGPSAVNVRNNIFSNNQAGNAGATLRFTAIALGYASPYTGLISNNNDLFSAGAGPGTYAIGTTGGLAAGTLRNTMADWRAETGQDLLSQNVLPVFVSATDLHLNNSAGTNWCLDGAGAPLAAVTSDIDCQTRNNPPDIGADEFNPTGFVITNPAPVCSPNTVDLTAAGITAGSMGGLTYTYFTDPAGTVAVANPTAVGAGTYYIRANNGSCTLIRPVVVTVLPSPIVNETHVEPTTCVSNDGSITLTVTGGGGPYSFAWTGTGVNPSSQNQTGLTAGSYTVVVRDIPNGCQTTRTIFLNGPGGCNVCPTIPNVSATPSPACVGANTTITSTGLTNMGVTYGITFKYSATALANPYSGGTTIATVPNAGLTAGGTQASTTTTFPTAGSYIVYAILSPAPLDPGCRPFAQVNLTVNQAPTISCPANIIVSNDLNQCGAIVNYPAAVVTGVPAPTVTYSTASGSFFPIGTTTVTATATNSCGTVSCTFTVRVNDTQLPTITCPANITVSNTTGQCGANVTFAVTATDNCPGVTVVSSPASGSFFPRGTTTVTSTATDASGNTRTCTFTVTVNDTQAPTITCPANITVNNTTGQCGANVSFTVTGTDNCPGLTIVSSPASGSFFPVGLTTVTNTATDASGNVTTCTFTVRVNDTQLPVITCPANITVNTPVGSCTAVVTYTVTATDNCPAVVVTRTAGPASGSAFPLGTTTVSHTATDASGNSVSCSFTVTVNDVQLPVISVQPSNRTVCAGTNATFTVTASNVVSYQWQQWNGTAFANIAGATASSYTVTNATSAMNTNTFRVILNGLCTIVTSGNATLFVNIPATVSLNAVPPPSLTPGFSTTLVATPSTGGGTYQWFRNGQLISNTGSTLGPITVDNQATYRVVYTDANGCTSSSADLVVNAMLTTKLWVYPNPNRGQFQVRYFNAPNDVATIVVHDALGQRVYRGSFSNTANPYSVINVDLGFEANGIYIVSLINGAGKIVGSQRINVQKFQ